jgi:bifunctional DNA-binding transcriptional regulator/antitoxin component of YhaV-PrlF toxin-antitoxin module
MKRIRSRPAAFSKVTATGRTVLPGEVRERLKLTRLRQPTMK